MSLLASQRCCKSDLDRILRGKRSLTKKQLLAEDKVAAIALPDDTFDYRKSTSTFASSNRLFVMILMTIQYL